MIFHGVTHQTQDIFQLTKGSGNNAIIMGRKTWESLPRKPLPKRENIILSRDISNIQLLGEELYFDSLGRSIEHCKEKNKDEDGL